MFNKDLVSKETHKKTLEELETTKAKLQELEKELNDQIFLKKEYKFDLETAEKSKNLDFKLLQKEYEANLALAQNEAKKNYQKDLESFKKTILELESKIAVEKEKVNSVNEKLKVYQDAFKNMGLDVKDMRGILNSIVDALVASCKTKTVQNIYNTKEDGDKK